MASLHNVSAAAGGLTLNNRTISGTVPAVNVNGGGFGGWRAARLRPAAALAKVA